MKRCHNLLSARRLRGIFAAKRFIRELLFQNKHILFTSRLQKISHFEFYILRASHMEKSSKNEKSLWIKSRKKPGPKKKGKIGFSEDRKHDLATKALGSTKKL